jgi:protein SCO1/2
VTVETSVERPVNKGEQGLTPLFILIIVGVTFAVGLWLGASTLHAFRHPLSVALKEGTLLTHPKPLADFALTDQDGRPFTLADLKGAWTFLSIGYTHCPDVCPMMLATFGAVARQIEQAGPERGVDARPRFLFVSVDPERDTPARLAQYVRYADPEFLGATGEDAQLRALTAQLGLLYTRVEVQDSAMGYLMDHSASILLLDPEGRLTAIFSAPHDAAGMASDFLTIAANHQS